LASHAFDGLRQPPYAPSEDVDFVSGGGKNPAGDEQAGDRYAGKLSASVLFVPEVGGRIPVYIAANIR
jgi:hypothetical protein